MLKKEYELMVQLDHPNIVKAYAKDMDDDLGPCIVMEYIDGQTLESYANDHRTGYVTLSGNGDKRFVFKKQ